MSRFRIVGRWLTAFAPHAWRSPSRRPSVVGIWPARGVPHLECLETRTVPSTLTVLNNADHGAGSLRTIVAAAANGDTIVFAHSVQDITLTSGQLAITKSLTIAGPGAGRLTISGNDASRVFDISNGATVTIDGVAVANGATVGGLGGGGILNEAGATLTLEHSVVTDNTATAASDVVDVFGGGLLNEGSASVLSSTFSGNQAVGGGGSSFFGGSVGGGIDNYGGATLTVTNSTFNENQALGSGAGDFGIGGAIESNAGLDVAHPSTATINNSLFIGNVAGGGTGVSGNGGAVDNEGPGTTMTLSNSTFLNNQSVGGTGGFGVGGAIMNYADSTCTIVTSTLIGNVARGGRGPRTTVAASTTRPRP